MMRDPLRFCAEATKELGDIYRIDVGPKTLVMVSDADHLKYILQDNNKNFAKGAMWAAARRVMGNGIAVSEGDLWLRQRRLIQPAFQRERLAAILETMAAVVQARVDEWSSAATRSHAVDVSVELVKMTGDVMLRSLFGKHASRQTLEALTAAFAVIRRSLDVAMWTSLFGERFPMPGRRRLAAAVEVVDAIVREVTRERKRAAANGADDLLGMLLDAVDPDTGVGMSTQQLRDEIVGMFFAAHETTAVAVTWTVYALTQYPSIADKLQDEARAVLKDRGITSDSLAGLTYTKMVFEESLRFYPAGWVIPRETVDDDEVGGYRVPAKSLVLVCPAVTHRSSRHFARPNEFHPEHFSPQNAATRSRYAFVPFGGGPRQCIGDRLATMEAQIILATIAAQYRVRLSRPVKPRPVNVQIHPEPHLAVYLDRVKSASAAATASSPV